MVVMVENTTVISIPTDLKIGKHIDRVPERVGGLLGNPPKNIGIYEKDANDLKETCWGYVNGNTSNVSGVTGIIVVYSSNGAVTQTIHNVFTGSQIHRSLLYYNGGFNKWSEWS